MNNWTRLGRTADHPAGIARYLETPDALYIWCDGTRNLQEWRWNFQTIRKWIKEHHRVRVNVKEYAQARLILDELVMINLDQPIWVLGYSRGGAIAQCLALMLSGPESQITVATFASKRTGNRAFLRKVRVINDAQRGDIVPFLPPWYARIPTYWWKPLMRPDKAHIAAAHMAALYRHELTQSRGE